MTQLTKQPYSLRDVELALALARIISDECKDAPHDIGLKLMPIIYKHFGITGEVLPSQEENERLREALERCYILFSNLRGDWSDNRHWCRQGWKIVEKALAGESLKDTLDEEAELEFASTHAALEEEKQ